MKFSSILRLMGTAMIAMCLASCQKGVDGSYHFKMSGSFECGVETMNQDSVYVIDDTSKFIISPISGQMRIVPKSSDEYLVNMSAMLGGELLPFNGKILNDSLFLDRQEVTIYAVKEGNSSPSISVLSSIGKPIRVIMSGRGRIYPDTIMLEMICEGDFYYTEEAKSHRCTILPQTSTITCAAYREQ